MLPIPIADHHRFKLVAALRRVNRQLSAWDELDAMALLPPTQRRTVAVPTLDREQLKSLQAELVGALGELAAGGGEWTAGHGLTGASVGGIVVLRRGLVPPKGRTSGGSMHSRLATRLVSALLIGSFAAASATTAGADHPGGGGRPLGTTLLGANERPGPGDPDGIGTAELRLNPGQGEICYELTVSGIDPATAAHIHIAPPTNPGPVVVPLAPPTDGTSSGCAAASRELIKAIMKNPGNYYVNVHNAAFPGGALRGQLSK